MNAGPYQNFGENLQRAPDCCIRGAMKKISPPEHLMRADRLANWKIMLIVEEFLHRRIIILSFVRILPLRVYFYLLLFALITIYFNVS